MDLLLAVVYVILMVIAVPVVLFILGVLGSLGAPFWILVVLAGAIYLASHPHTPKKKADRKELLEDLADLEHRQWMEWAKAVEGEVSPERRRRWREQFYRPYDQLSEPAKESDREWAEEALGIIERHCPDCFRR